MFYIELIRAVRLNQTVNKSNEVKPDSCECEWANVDFKDVLGKQYPATKMETFYKMEILQMAFLCV